MYMRIMYMGVGRRRLSEEAAPGLEEHAGGHVRVVAACAQRRQHLLAAKAQPHQLLHRRLRHPCHAPAPAPAPAPA